MKTNKDYVIEVDKEGTLHTVGPIIMRHPETRACQYEVKFVEDKDE